MICKMKKQLLHWWRDNVVTPSGPDNVVLVNLTGDEFAGGGYQSTGNWNNVPLVFPVPEGNIPIKGDSISEDLTSLRDTNGNLTGIGIGSVDGNFIGQNLGKNTDGLYPGITNLWLWYYTAFPGVSRTFKLTGLNNSITYQIKVMSSVDKSFVEQPRSAITLHVSGASGGGTYTEFESDNNVNNVMLFEDVVPSGGEITFTATSVTTQFTAISVIEINWNNS